MAMRNLYLVPVIHSGPDMGSMAANMEASAVAALGEDLWRQHKETVAKFWDSIADFFHQISISGAKVYQDGLVADGENGLRIVSEGARRGSANYRIIVDIVRRGATLMKTEDVSLVKREHSYIAKLTEAKSLLQKETAALRYKLVQRRLLEERDKFIARTIDSTLHEGDTGILFIGAYHDVLSKLPADIRVVQVKEVTKVREYHRTITDMAQRGHVQHLQQLAEYLVQPVSDASL